MKCREMLRNVITLEMTELTRGKTTQRVEISDRTVQSYATISFLYVSSSKDDFILLFI